MQDIYINLVKNIIIKIKTKETIQFNESIAKAYIPGIIYISNQKQKVNFTLEYKLAKTKSLQKSKNHIVIKENWQKSFPLDFYHLLYNIVQTQYLTKNIFSVHSSFVNNILIVGHSGVGKTTISLKLLQKYKMPLITTNKTLVSFAKNNMEVLGGTTTVTLAKDNTKDNNKSKINYSDRKLITIDNDLIKKQKKENNLIKKIILPQLNDGVKICKKLEGLSPLHKLFPYFLDTVNASTILFDGDFVFSTNIEAKTKQYLSKNLSKKIKKINTFQITGSLNFICNKIKNI